MDEPLTKSGAKGTPRTRERASRRLSEETEESGAQASSAAAAAAAGPSRKQQKSSSRDSQRPVALAGGNEFARTNEEPLDLDVAHMSEEEFQRFLKAATMEDTRANLVLVRKSAMSAAQQQQQQQQSVLLAVGTETPFLGYGSLAWKYKSQVDAVLKSNKEGDPNNMGLMLSHHFYRSFLHHVHTYSDQDQDQDQDEATSKEFSDFHNAYELMWNKTKVGIQEVQGDGDDKALETNTTALISAFLNQLIPTFVNQNSGITPNKPKIAWVSEYELKATDTDANNKVITKKSRTDGLLVAADPLSNNAFRPLVSMEANVHGFNANHKLQSRSNAADAFALKPDGSLPWPLLVFQFSYEASGISIYVYAVVPAGKAVAMNVLLWKYNGGRSNGIFIVFKAAIKASMEFLNILQQRKKQIPFIPISYVLGDVAIDPQEKYVYKSFYNDGTSLSYDHRHINLDLIKLITDPEAEEVSLGHCGSFLKMKYFGPIILQNCECDSQRFLEIAADLQTLHNQGYCHGDIRVSNLVLAGDIGKIIDFDFAGETNKHTYPETLQHIVDGDRHEDVNNEIENDTVGNLKLQTAHDWHSLRQAMYCFEAKDAKNKSAWQDLINNIEEMTKQKVADSSKDEQVDDHGGTTSFTLVLTEEKQKLRNQTRS